MSDARALAAPSTITVVGTVEPVRRSRVGSEIPGIVRDMPAREGDLIQEGGLLCKLLDDILCLRLAEQEAKLAALKDRHQELLAGTREQELTRLRALRDEAVARYEQWKFEMGRVEGLYAGRTSNDKEYQDTKAEFLAAERRKIATEAAYQLGVEGPRAETIAEAAHAVAEQQAVVDRAAIELHRTAIKAPFRGYIVDRLVDVGEWISSGDAVVEMVDLSSVLVRVDAPESALPYLSPGHPVQVSVGALGRSFDGRIRHVMRQADPEARTFPVKIEVENNEGHLAAGMFARAAIPAGADEQVVAVPKDALVERDGLTYLAMLLPGREGGLQGMLQPVTIGADVGDWIAVTSDNVQAGTQVIIRGTERMLPFPMPVQVVDELGTPVAMPDRAPDSAGKDGA